MHSREDFRLKLRKEKLEDRLLERRTLFSIEGESKYEINTHFLNVPDNIRESLLSFQPLNVCQSLLVNCLRSEDPDIQKYALNYLRKMLTGKTQKSGEILNVEIISILLRFLEFSDDNSVLVFMVFNLVRDFMVPYQLYIHRQFFVNEIAKFS
jgi:hypothetical protein